MRLGFPVKNEIISKSKFAPTNFAATFNPLIPEDITVIISVILKKKAVKKLNIIPIIIPIINRYDVINKTDKDLNDYIIEIYYKLYYYLKSFCYINTLVLKDLENSTQ